MMKTGRNLLVLQCVSVGLHHGFLPMEFPYSRQRIILLDRAKMIGHFAPGIDISLHPFFGSMGVAPGGGRVDSGPPFFRMRATWIIKSSLLERLSIPVAAKSALFVAATAIPDRATARWTSPRWRPS
jgi:acetamidase/formamidase